jgi:hypothetical protein
VAVIPTSRCNRCIAGSTDWSMMPRRMEWNSVSVAVRSGCNNLPVGSDDGKHIRYSMLRERDRVEEAYGGHSRALAPMIVSMAASLTYKWKASDFHLPMRRTMESSTPCCWRDTAPPLRKLWLL